MSRPKSPRLIAALADVAAGMTVYRAAKVHGLAQSTISRTLNPPQLPRCPGCGRTLRAKKGQKTVKV